MPGRVRHPLPPPPPGARRSTAWWKPRGVHSQLSAQLGGPEPWVLSDFQQLGV